MPEISEPTKEQIEQLAYEIFLERGCEHGKDVDDWLAAEQELWEVAEAKSSWAGLELGAEQELRAEHPAGKRHLPKKETTVSLTSSVSPT